MFGWTLLVSAALAGTPVVAVGDELVVAAAEPGGGGTGGWVQSLADCLDERAPDRWTVMDRGRTGETLRAVRGRVDELRELAGPTGVVVLGLGARELAVGVVSAELRAELEQLVGSLKVRPGPTILLVDPIAPDLGGGEGDSQVVVDSAVSGLTRAFDQVARESPAIQHVRLWSDWPRDGRARRVLTERSRTLTARGHARVAAAVCDAIVESAESDAVE
ncbi:MAG: hypothetical protein ACI8PZ_000698 [Myxococcota bacterium]|jgi:hypothetical protein